MCKCGNECKKYGYENYIVEQKEKYLKMFPDLLADDIDVQLINDTIIGDKRYLTYKTTVNRSDGDGGSIMVEDKKTFEVPVEKECKCNEEKYSEVLDFFEEQREKYLNAFPALNYDDIKIECIKDRYIDGKHYLVFKTTIDFKSDNDSPNEISVEDYNTVMVEEKEDKKEWEEFEQKCRDYADVDDYVDKDWEQNLKKEEEIKKEDKTSEYQLEEIIFEWIAREREKMFDSLIRNFEKESNLISVDDIKCEMESRNPLRVKLTFEKDFHNGYGKTTCEKVIEFDAEKEIRRYKLKKAETFGGYDTDYVKNVKDIDSMIFHRRKEMSGWNFDDFIAHCFGSLFDYFES